MEKEIIKEVFSDYLNKWKIIVILFVTCLLFVGIHNMIKAPIYERTATIIAKENNSPMSDILTNTIDLAQNHYYVNLANDLVTVTSSQSMMRVIKKLNLNTQCFVRDRLKKRMLYGSSQPFIFTFVDELYDQNFTFKFRVEQDSIIKIIDLEDNGIMEINELSYGINDTINVIPGALIISNNNSFKGKYNGEIIEVRHFSPWDIVNEMTNNLSTNLLNEYAIVVNVNYRDYNIERADDILNTLLDDYLTGNNRLLESNINSIDRRVSIIQQSLDSLHKERNLNHDESVDFNIKAYEDLYKYLLHKKEDVILSQNVDYYELQMIMNPRSCAKNNPVNFNITRNLLYVFIFSFIFPFLILYYRKLYTLNK